MGILPRLLEEVLSGTHPGWGWGKRETSSPDSLALVGGAPISDTQVSPSEQRLRAGNRDFLMPTKMEGVRGTQATPGSATLTPGSSFSRKEEVNELTSKAKVTQECGGLGWGAAWGQFGVPDLWDLLPHLWAAPGTQLLATLSVNAEVPWKVGTYPERVLFYV